MKPLPIACELTPEQLAERRSSLLADLVRRAAEVEPRESGYRFVFAGDPESIALVLAAVEAERSCCRFFRFTVVFEQDLGPVALEIEGPDGTREFLSALLAPDERGAG